VNHLPYIAGAYGITLAVILWLSLDIVLRTGAAPVTRKQRRLSVMLACGLGLGAATALTLSALGSGVAFFLAPADIDRAPHDREFRLGGLVQAGSVVRADDGGEPDARFRVTDGKGVVTVTYRGILPDLFRQGIVALGRLEPDGTFRAQEVLAKHDATYMPKEVVEALKKSGMWNPSSGAAPPASTWNMTIPPAREGG
jgi:cytochrome c-type biogenesis protein CcmE